jgi:hypothetical protein
LISTTCDQWSIKYCLPPLYIFVDCDESSNNHLNDVKFLFWSPKYIQVGEIEQMVEGANGISWAKPTPLGDCLLGVYFRIFLESFEQKSLRKSWKIFQIFITLLCYGLHF